MSFMNCTIKSRNVRLSFIGELTVVNINKIKSGMKKLLSIDADSFHVDFSTAVDMDIAFIQLFYSLCKRLNNDKKTVRIIGGSARLLSDKMRLYGIVDNEIFFFTEG